MDSIAWTGVTQESPESEEEADQIMEDGSGEAWPPRFES